MGGTTRDRLLRPGETFELGLWKLSLADPAAKPVMIRFDATDGSLPYFEPRGKAIYVKPVRAKPLE